MKNRSYRNLAVNVLALALLLIVTSSCIVDHVVHSSYYIENNSGRDVSFSSDQKTMTIANGSVALVGVYYDEGSFSGVHLGHFFGDTLEVRFDDSTALYFYGSDTLRDSRNPYHEWNWAVVPNVAEHSCQATFTVDEDFLNAVR